MRSTMTKLSLALGLLVPGLGGCNHAPIIRDHQRPPEVAQGKADAASLVNYMNLNSRRMQNVRAKVAIDAKIVDPKQGTQAIGLDGLMACQRPRDFRLKASLLASPTVDIGSNKDEFWYWISKAPQPYVFYCSYPNLASGKVQVPFPFQPDMILAALNMAEYDAKAKYTLKEQPRTLELTQDTTSPTGQPVKRVTVFNRTAVKAPQPQVLAHVLTDAKGALICKATVHKVAIDRDTNAIVPTSVTIEWPAQKMSMKLMLSHVEVNALDAKMAPRLFSRSDLAKHDSYDLARGLITPTSGVRRASATVPTQGR